MATLSHEINSNLIMKWIARIISERKNSTDSALSKPNKDFGKRCFSYSAAYIWNKLPLEAKIAPTVWSFKKIIQQE